MLNYAGFTRAVNKIGGFMGASTLRSAARMGMARDFAGMGKQLYRWADAPGRRGLARLGAVGAVGAYAAYNNPRTTMAAGAGALAYKYRGALRGSYESAKGLAGFQARSWGLMK